MASMPDTRIPLQQEDLTAAGRSESRLPQRQKRMVSAALGLVAGMIAFSVMNPSGAHDAMGDSIVSFDIDCISHHLGARNGNSDMVKDCEVANHGLGQVLPKAFASKLMTRPMSKVASSRPAPLSMQTHLRVPPPSMQAMDEIDSHGSVMTLSRYMIELSAKNPDFQEMESLMSSIQMACKTIANLVARAGIQDLTGMEAGGGSVNVQGEEQKKLDVISNTVMKNALRFSGKVGVVGSEEEDNPVLIEEQYGGRYAAVFDPLDGSSNIDAAISTGTIFGIFEEDGEECIIDAADDLDEAQVKCLTQTLQPGTRMRAAGYCMYSSSTILVLTLGNGVNGFTLDPNIGEFVLTHPNIKIPKRGKIYSINEANYYDWDPALQTYVNNLKAGKGESGEKYSARYIGSMVGDVHRTLLYGGLFGYPGDAKNPNGKLRLLYEGAPMSFILEQAGGKTTTGSQRVMDIVPKGVHQRVPVFLGSPDDIDEVEKVYKEAGLVKNY